MEELEQPKTLDAGSKSLGKFKDAESLMKAYNSLEAEFTKKSQRLSMLEQESEKINEAQRKKETQEKMVDEFVSKFEIAKPFSSALKATLAENEQVDLKDEAIRLIASTHKTAEQFSTDADFLNNYIFSNQEIKDVIIREYLKKLPQSSPIKIENSSKSISLTPPASPKTIADAKQLAKSIIKQK